MLADDQLPLLPLMCTAAMDVHADTTSYPITGWDAHSPQIRCFCCYMFRVYLYAYMSGFILNMRNRFLYLRVLLSCRTSGTGHRIAKRQRWQPADPDLAHTPLSPYPNPAAAAATAAAAAGMCSAWIAVFFLLSFLFGLELGELFIIYMQTVFHLAGMVVQY